MVVPVEGPVALMVDLYPKIKVVAGSLALDLQVETAQIRQAVAVVVLARSGLTRAQTTLVLVVQVRLTR